MKPISWQDFESVDMRVGTIVDVQDFPEARNPAYKVWVDFWEDIGIKKTSAQITELYTRETLIGKQVIGVINFPPKQIANFTSEFLITWFHTESWVILVSTDSEIKNGLRLL